MQEMYERARKINMVLSSLRRSDNWYPDAAREETPLPGTGEDVEGLVHPWKSWAFLLVFYFLSVICGGNEELGESKGGANCGALQGKGKT